MDSLPGHLPMSEVAVRAGRGERESFSGWGRIYLLSFLLEMAQEGLTTFSVKRLGSTIFF